MALLFQEDGEETQMDISTQPSTSKSSLWNAIDEDTGSRTPVCSGLIEVRQFVEDNTLIRTGDPLQYWKRKEIVAGEVSQTPSITSCHVRSSEKVFSAAGELVSESRSRLKPDNLEKIMFLHENTEYFDA